MAIVVKVHSTIHRPSEEVFDAMVDPAKMTGYFISEASGPMEAGKTIHWTWGDAGVSCDIEVLEVRAPDRIVFEWTVVKVPSRVEITLTAQPDGSTRIDISEDGFQMDDEGVNIAMGQTQGWTDFICSLKAYLYTGINLRTGR